MFMYLAMSCYQTNFLLNLLSGQFRIELKEFQFGLFDISHCVLCFVLIISFIFVFSRLMSIGRLKTFNYDFRSLFAGSLAASFFKNPL